MKKKTGRAAVGKFKVGDTAFAVIHHGGQPRAVKVLAMSDGQACISYKPYGDEEDMLALVQVVELLRDDHDAAVYAAQQEVTRLESMKAYRKTQLEHAWGNFDDTVMAHKRAKMALAALVKK